MTFNKCIWLFVTMLGSLFISMASQPYKVHSAAGKAQQKNPPTPWQAHYIITPSKILLRVGETTNVQMDLHTADGCNFGSAHIVFKAIDEDGEDSNILVKISHERGIRPISTSTWQAKQLGSVRLIAYSFGEGVCQTDPNVPPPFFNASAGGSSPEILIVETILQTYLPTIGRAE